MVEPYSDKGRLKIVKREVKKHIEWLKLETGEWETHSMGVPVRDMNLLLDTIDADRKKIVDYKNMLNQRAACYIKAKQEVKGLKNRIEELKEALDRAITEMETWRDLDDCECESGEHICGLQRLKESIKIARAAQGEEGEKK